VGGGGVERKGEDPAAYFAGSFTTSLRPRYELDTAE